MTLNEYLVGRGKLAQLARVLGVSPGTVHDWKVGRRTPSLPLAVAVERATQGQVRAASLIPAPQPAEVVS